MKTLTAIALGSLWAPALLAGQPAHPCPADVNTDGILNPADFTAWLNAFNAGDDAADINADGSVAPADFTAWLGAFNAGCNLADSDNDRIPDLYESGDGQFLAPYATGTHPLNADSDTDNIEDGDEIYGTLLGLDLPALGANPNRKDIFIETDWTDDSHEIGFHSHRPQPDMVALVVETFENAPHANPDGSTGISVHIDYGQGGPFTGGNEIFAGQNVEWLSTGQIGNYMNSFMAPERDGYFHYSIFCHRYNSASNDSSGFAAINGDWFFVTLYTFWNNDQFVANTLVHELGHNLGLRHGGFENRNRKPNYPSVMNYNFQFAGVDTDCNGSGDGLLDFSHGFLPDLEESDLDEFFGICGTVPLDWDRDGVLESSVTRNINCPSVASSQPCGSSGSCADSACTLLRDHDDWASIRFLGMSRQPFPEHVACPGPAGAPQEP